MHADADERLEGAMIIPGTIARGVRLAACVALAASLLPVAGACQAPTRVEPYVLIGTTRGYGGEYLNRAGLAAFTGGIDFLVIGRSSTRVLAGFGITRQLYSGVIAASCQRGVRHDCIPEFPVFDAVQAELVIRREWSRYAASLSAGPSLFFRTGPSSAQQAATYFGENAAASVSARFGWAAPSAGWTVSYLPSVDGERLAIRRFFVGASIR